MLPASHVSARRSHKAFTLVELLVVFGIIALLMSILLPALGKAREHARQVKCANNERQLYYALLMYCGDNKGRLPIFPRVEDNNLMSPYLGIIELQLVQLDYAHGMFIPYMGGNVLSREQAFNCPTDLDTFRQVFRSGGTNGPASFVRNFSYSFNSEVYGSTLPNGLPSGVRITQIMRPAQKILIVEETAPNDGYAVIDNINSDDHLTYRHLKKGNQGFADGHVEAINPDEVGNDYTSAQTMAFMVERRLHYCNLYYND